MAINSVKTRALTVSHVRTKPREANSKVLFYILCENNANFAISVLTKNYVRSNAYWLFIMKKLLAAASKEHSLTQRRSSLSPTSMDSFHSKILSSLGLQCIHQTKSNAPYFISSNILGTRMT